MHRISRLMIGMGAIATLVGCAPMTPPTMTPPTMTAPELGDSSYQLQQVSLVRAGMFLNSPEGRAFMAVFREVNAMRAAAGLPALSAETSMIRAAARHSQDMATRNYMAHTSPEGTTAADRMRSAGATFTTWGENIGYQGPPNDTAATRMMGFWRTSPGHRANILNPRFKRTGIYAYRRASDGTMYFTQVFAD